MGLGTVGLLQLIIVALSLPQAGDLLSLPIRNDDSAGHFYSALHAAAHWRNAGALWGYDPHWMAGYPEGIAPLVDNKLFAVIVSLAPLGWAAAVYNAGFILALLSPPWILYGASRAAGASAAVATGAALAAVVASFSVPLTVGFLVWGGTSFFLAAALVVPATIAVAGAIASGGLLRPRGLAALALTFAVLFVHPGVLPPLLAGIVPAFVVGRRRRAGLLVDAASLGIVVAVAFLPILEVYAELRGQLESNFDPHAVFLRNPGSGILRGGIGQLKEDWWTYLLRIDGGPHGAGGLLGLVLLALLGGPSGREVTDARSGGRSLQRWVVLCAAAAAFLLAYVVSSVHPRGAALEPHRFVLVMGFFLCLPAGAGLARCWAEICGPRRRWLGGVVALVALVIAVRAAVGLGQLLVFGTGWDPAEEALVDLIKRQGDGGGRTLVESELAAAPSSPGASRTIGVKRFALLPLRTGREFLGYYFTGSHVAQRYAAFQKGGALGRKLADLDDAQAGILLRRYAVTRVVGCAPATIAELRRLTGALEAEAELADCQVFRVRDAEPSRLLEGKGVVEAELDRIAVRGAGGERLVLKYHWLPTLRTEPPLPIEEAPQPGAPVGFIAVRPGGQRDFDIVQARSRSTLALAVSALRARLHL